MSETGPTVQPEGATPFSYVLGIFYRAVDPTFTQQALDGSHCGRGALAGRCGSGQGAGLMEGP